MSGQRGRRTARQIRIAELVANPDNVRDSVGEVNELARSIRQQGILQPLTVTEDPKMRGWLLLAGHRRLAAAQQAGLTTVPCFIHHDLGKDVTEQTVVMLIENVQRKNLSPMEKARAYGRLQADGLSASEISRRTGIHVSTVVTHLALLEVDDETAERIEDGDITAGDAIAAVREQRALRRTSNGTPARGRPVIVEPKHFAASHPLYVHATAICDHTTRPRVGDGKGGPCGQCWEAVIRADALCEPMPEPVFDEVVVNRIVSGGVNVRTSGNDRVEVVRRWRALGRSLSRLADQTGWKVDRYDTPDNRAGQAAAS